MRTRMQVIPEAFFYATVAGLWPSTICKLTRSKKYYKLFTLLNILVMYSIVALELAAMLYVTGTKNELIESLHVFLTLLNGCVKSANILMRRKKYVELAKMFLDERCMPKTAEETKVCCYYDSFSRMTTIGISVLGELTAFMYAMKPLFFIREKYTSAARVWLPYSINSSLTFWPTFLHQALAGHVIAAWNVSNDVLAVGFMLQICSQLQLVSLRLKSLPGVVKGTKWPTERLARQFERNVVKQCVSHHLYVVEIVKSFKLTFAPIILSQYYLSGFMICLTIYQLVINHANISTLMIEAIYLICMIIELGVYCWFGNEITLKIKDFIYEGDWSQLHPRTIKCLMIVMLRASSPVFVTYGPFVTLSNAAYMGILKVSYSAYSVLKKIH